MKTLDNYFKSCEEVKKAFVKKYFDCPTDIYWIADKIGEVLAVNDYFFDMRFMITALLFNVSGKKMFRFYDYDLQERQTGKSPMNFENWLKLKKYENNHK